MKDLTEHLNESLNESAYPTAEEFRDMDKSQQLDTIADIINSEHSKEVSIYFDAGNSGAVGVDSMDENDNPFDIKKTEKYINNALSKVGGKSVTIKKSSSKDYPYEMKY